MNFSIEAKFGGYETVEIHDMGWTITGQVNRSRKLPNDPDNVVTLNGGFLVGDFDGPLTLEALWRWWEDTKRRKNIQPRPEA